MNRSFTIVPQQAPEPRLRAIGEQDLEALRLWKNANRKAFFFKGKIEPAAQGSWYEGYLRRPDDHMFMVESGGGRAGCMGFRLVDGEADCYNIIGDPEFRGKGLLALAMRLMCSYIVGEKRAPAGCLVLKDNPALKWYERIGFIRAADKGDHYKLELGPSFERVPYAVLES